MARKRVAASTARLFSIRPAIEFLHFLRAALARVLLRTRWPTLFAKPDALLRRDRPSPTCKTACGDPLSVMASIRRPHLLCGVLKVEPVVPIVVAFTRTRRKGRAFSCHTDPTAAHAVGHVVRDHFHPNGAGPATEEPAEKTTTEVH